MHAHMNIQAYPEHPNTSQPYPKYGKQLITSRILKTAIKLTFSTFDKCLSFDINCLLYEIAI